MDKKYLLLTIPMLSLFLMCSVMAFDFSVRGNDVIKMDNVDYKVDVNMWHNDGRAPTCYTPLWCSKGITPQGQGTIQITSLTKGFHYTINANLKEDSSSFTGNVANINATAKGTFWFKGITPQQITIPVSYKYDASMGTLALSFQGSDDYVSIPVKRIK